MSRSTDTPPSPNLATTHRGIHQKEKKEESKVKWRTYQGTIREEEDDGIVTAGAREEGDEDGYESKGDKGDDRTDSPPALGLQRQG